MRDDPPPSARSSTQVFRFGERAVLFDVNLGNYRGLLFVITGEKSVSVTMFDDSDANHGEAQVFVLAKPYGWSLDRPDDEALLEVWQAIGVQR